MKLLISYYISFAEVLKLIEIIIWPTTLLLAILFFRRNLAGIISNIGSVKAGASGFEMTFQEKLNSVANLIETDSGDRSKSASTISVGTNSMPTPYDQLLGLRDSLNAKIANKAALNNLISNTNTTYSTIDELKSSGLITIQKARQLHAFMDLTSSATRNVDQISVDRAKELYNKIDI